MRQRCRVASGSAEPIVGTSPGWRVGDHELHPGQAANDQPTQERHRAVLGRGHVQTEDLAVAVAVGVDAGGDHGVDVDHAALPIASTSARRNGL